MKSDSFKNNRKALAALLICTGFIAAHPLAMRAESSGPSVQTVQQQQIKVTGTVNDDMVPVIGASVVEKGNPSNGTITDIDGNFSLSVKPGATLLISYIGYKSQEVQAISGKSVNITLKEDTEMLDEVVVVGFGTQKKVNLTGAVGTLSSDELKERPVANATQALQGLVPGLNIDVTNGSLESRPDINIRGTATIGEGTSGAPLILIDGMEGELHSINPQDIANISVLKDAAASSIYGSRAPFGVVLITTKSGTKDGKTSINYNNSFRFGSPINKKEMMNSVQFASWVNDALTNNGGSPRFNEAYMDRLITWQNAKPYAPGQRMTADGTIVYPIEAQASGQWYGGFSTGADDVNYYDVVYKDHTFSQEHNVSASGGSKKFNYYASGSYFDQDGLLNVGEENLQRFTATAKINSEITDWLKFNMNMRFTREDYVRPSALTDYFYEALAFKAWPILPLYDRNGYYYYSDDTSVAALAEGGSDKKQTDHFYFQTGLEIEPVKNCVTSVDFNYRIKSANRHWDSQPYINHDLSGAPYYRKSSSNVHEDYLKENYFNFNARSEYSFSLADSHNFHILGGFQAENLKQNLFGLQRNGIMINSKPEVDLTNGLDIDGNPITPSVNGGRNEWSTVGFFGRLNYDYKNRYLFEFSGRYDGSSRFARGHRYGFFPSVSAGWRINEEKFFAPLRKQISNLKLRFSLGALGNQQVGYYDYLQTISSGGTISYAFGDKNKASGASISAPNASDFTWETVVTKNIGLDLGLLNNRLNMTADIYVRDTKDMLMASKDLPNVYGASSPKTNAANLRTKGWEASISWNDSFNLKGKAFHYSVVLGLADNTTKVTKYNNDNKTLGTPYEGQQLGEIWGYVVDGLFKTDEEAENYPVNQSYVNNILNISVKSQGLHAGDVKYVDLDGDNIISPTLSANDVKDQKVIGNSLPRYTYSVRLAADWNGIDFSALLQGVGRQHWYPNGETSLFWGPYARPYCTFIPKDFLTDVWSEDNPDAYFPRPRGYVALDVNPRELSKPNTRYLQNVAYCRLKNVTVGYSLPRTWLKALHMERVRVYFSGENLFTFSPLHSNYIDPEHAGASTSWKSGHTNVTSYPMSKTYSFGIDVTF